MNSLSNNNKPKQQIRGSFFENLKDLSSGTVKTAVSESGKIAGGVLSGMVRGGGTQPLSPWENQMNKSPLSAERFPKKTEWTPPAKPWEIQVFSHLEREKQLEDKIEIKRLVDEIRKEIVLLQKKQKTVISEAAKITVEMLPTNPGPYHIRFFEWLLKLLRDLRKRVSESATWLGVLRSKKRQRGYWKMYKKHGTSFGLSGERSVATQAG